MTHTVVTHKACTNGLSSLRLLLIWNEASRKICREEKKRNELNWSPFEFPNWEVCWQSSEGERRGPGMGNWVESTCDGYQQTGDACHANLSLPFPHQNRSHGESHPIKNHQFEWQKRFPPRLITRIMQGGIKEIRCALLCKFFAIAFSFLTPDR